MQNAHTLHFPFLARVLHWTLALCVIANLWITHEETITHENVGITAFAVVCLRLLLAKPLGAPKIRLAPNAWRQHMSELTRRELVDKYNPAAACMIWLLWIWVLITSASGYLGYYYLWAEDLMDVHEFFAQTLQYIVGLHISAIVFLSLYCKQNLVRRMFFK